MCVIEVSNKKINYRYIKKCTNNIQSNSNGSSSNNVRILLSTNEIKVKKQLNIYISSHIK